MTLKYTPQQFHELPLTKRVHWISMAYMQQCTLEGFSKKSMFQLKGYFRKLDSSKLQVIYDYIYDLPEVTVVSLYDIHAASEKYQGQLRLNSGNNEGETVKAYDSLLDLLGKI